MMHGYTLGLVSIILLDCLLRGKLTFISSYGENFMMAKQLKNKIDNDKVFLATRICAAILLIIALIIAIAALASSVVIVAGISIGVAPEATLKWVLWGAVAGMFVAKSINDVDLLFISLFLTEWKVKDDPLVKKFLQTGKDQ